MQNTWGRRVSGTVRKGKTSTRFHLEVVLENGSFIEETIVLPNFLLLRYPASYGHALEEIVKKLEQRLNDRHQSWLRSVGNKNTS